MISSIKTKLFQAYTDAAGIRHTEYLHDYYGLSTDTKPTENVANASSYVEMDTCKVYLFDEENAQWREWTSTAENAALSVYRNSLVYPKSPTTD